MLPENVKDDCSPTLNDNRAGSGAVGILWKLQGMCNPGEMGSTGVKVEDHVGNAVGLDKLSNSGKVALPECRTTPQRELLAAADSD